MIAFVGGNLFAQSYNFDQYNVGDKVAQTIGQPWTTWSEQPGSAEDAVFSDEQAVSGTNSVKFTYGNDQIYNFYDATTGSYTLDWNMYIPSGKDAYLNIQHNFTGGQDGEWAFGLYFNTTDQGTALHVSNAYHEFTFPFDTWFPVHFDIDLDNDAISLTIDGTEVHSWAFSEAETSTTPGMRVLDALDFYPPTSASKSVFYIDDFSFVSSQEDEVLVLDPFEEYTVGNKIAVEAIAAGHDWWTTWSNAPGGSEDGVVAELEGTQCGHLTYGVDQVLLLGDQDNGAFTLSFDMYIPNGKDAYNNVLHAFAGSGSEWATEVYYKSSSEGTKIKAANVETNFECPYDAWFDVKYEIDLDNDVATFFVEGNEIVTWQFSKQASGSNGIRQLAAMDFYPPTSAAVSDYYIDNISVVKLGGVSAPHFAIAPDFVDETLGEDDMTSVEITIDNTGNSIGDWNGWIEFGQGGAGSQTTDLYYHNGEVASGIGSSSAYTREMGVRLPASAYAGAAMGMKVVSAKYYIYDSYASADHNYIFRIYGQGANNQPGELLAEKTVNSTAMGTWITATFDEDVYMTGQAMWATVQLEQIAGEYPLSMDGGEYGEEADGNWLSTNGGNFSHCYSAGSFGGAWLITVNCQGELIPATWASINKTEGAIMGGQSDVITLSLNTIGLDEGTYEATLVINTNDEELPHVEIPVSLYADITALAENGAQIATIYPNPATTQVTLTGDNLSSLAIYNVTGQLVRVMKLDTTTINLDLEAGVYFFSVYDMSGNNSVQRVVITK